MAAGLSDQSRLPSGAIEMMRQHVFIDTTLLHPALIRASVDLLGADNVVAGSDWPIAGEKALRGMLTHAMQQAKLSADEQTAVAAGNSMRLLGIGGMAA
jgi:predicted TIM-barrel fold metal-dependent hydrolase